MLYSRSGENPYTLGFRDIGVDQESGGAAGAIARDFGI